MSTNEGSPRKPRVVTERALKYYRCQCGDSSAFALTPPYPCSKCRTCGTGLVADPRFRQEPKPHDMRPGPNQAGDSTTLPYRCGWCQRTQAEIEEDTRSLE